MEYITTAEVSSIEELDYDDDCFIDSDNKSVSEGKFCSQFRKCFPIINLSFILYKIIIIEY